MSVVSSKIVTSSFFALVRARRELEKAFKAEEWDKVRRWDLVLADLLNDAFDDENRNTQALVEELQKVLKLYGLIVKAIPDAAVTMVSPPQFL